MLSKNFIFLTGYKLSKKKLQLIKNTAAEEHSALEELQGNSEVENHPADRRAAGGKA